MFEKIRRMMGRYGATSSNAGPANNSNTKVTLKRNTPTAESKPNLSSTRATAPETATRARSNATFGAPSADSIMAEKRHHTANHGAAPANINRDNRRVEKMPRHADRVKGGQFLDTATASGARNLRQTKAKEVQFKSKAGLTDGIMLRHRSGSITGLQLTPNDSKVKSAFHTSITTGETTHVDARQIKGKTAKALNQIAHKRDHRHLKSE